MNNIYLTPGPTQIHSVAKQATIEALENDIASISHRSKDFEQINEFTKNELIKLFNLPKDYQVFFISSGTESWERIIQGSVQKKSLHYINGAFSKRFSETATELGKSPKNVEKDLGLGFGLGDISEPEDAELVAVTLNETSTGVSLEKGFTERFNQLYPDKLLAVDAVSAAPILELDLNAVDYYFFSVQKYFSMPAGLGVLFVSPRGIQRAKELQAKNFCIGSHHSLLSLQNYAAKNQTPTTPNVLSIFILGQMTAHLNSVGIEQLRNDTHEKARLLYNYLDSSKSLSAFVKETKFRSETVITVNAGSRLKESMVALAKQGLIVGEGYGKLKESQFRVANFAAHSKQNFEALISVLEQI